MLIAALRDLQWRRRRFIIAVLGTALVFSMTLVLAGLSAAFVNEVDRTIETTGADEWAIAVGATGPFNSSAVLPAGALAAARRLAGVQDADPFIAIGATIPGDTPKHVTMIGAVPGGVGSPKVDDGRAPRRTGRDRGRQPTRQEHRRHAADGRQDPEGRRHGRRFGSLRRHAERLPHDRRTCRTSPSVAHRSSRRSRSAATPRVFSRTRAS